MPGWVPPSRGSTTAARLGAATRSAGDDSLPRIEALVRRKRAGIQRIRLADHGAQIDSGSSYQWLLKLVPNPKDRSYDRIVGGGIERVEPSQSLSQQLDSASPERRAHVLAGNGIWYDAIDDLSVRIDAAPGDRGLWNQRAHLFQQVGLPEVDLESGAADGFQRR